MSQADPITSAPSPASAAIEADVIYFMMMPGWAEEMRSNRWHYASRWARQLPVVLLQPGGDVAPPLAEDRLEPSIPNCRILGVASSWGEQSQVLLGVTQAELIRQDMQKYGYSKPIFWIYNPAYIAPFFMIPAVARVVHATENYFDYPPERTDLCFLDRLGVITRQADGVICCSDGVARAYRAKGARQVAVVTNGCDYAFYAQGGRHERLAEAGADFSRIAVFAGNLDDRLDFDYLRAAADRHPSILFAFFGPVHLGDDLHQQWRALLEKPNARHFGRVPVEELPAIYATADLGIIPYSYSRLTTENTFPLKAFEMLASGLPLVATNLDMLKSFSTAGFVVCADAESFVATCGRLSRHTLSAAESAALRSMAQAQDYDHKFTAAMAFTSSLVGPATAPAAEFLGYGQASCDLAFKGLAGIMALEHMTPGKLWNMGLQYLRIWRHYRISPLLRLFNVGNRQP